MNTQFPNFFDFQIREIGAFCGLMIDANPNVIETLFMENVIYENEFFKELKTKRDWFITQKFVVKCK